MMKVLVYGGTGSQGGGVVWKLLEKGHTPYILTRHPEKAQPMVNAGAQTIAGDLSDPDSLRTASEQVDAISLMLPAFVPDPTQTPTFARNAIDAAKAAGNKFIVYNTSGPVIVERTGNPAYDTRLDIIDYLKQSGVPSVIIQPTAYMENLLGPWTRPNIIERDTLSYPVEDQTPLGWIATEDVGALIVAALERPELAGQHFIVSGVQNLTGPELAAQFTTGLGRPIQYYSMPLEEFGAALDTAFGPGAGEGGIQGYKFQRENADKLTMWVDMTPVLEKLPVKMTSAAEWAAKFKQAFAPMSTQMNEAQNA
ncbi:MAG: NmrA family NAD(P)-binding protein [bacterium]|nr:NmrA family NAD(P)-binding protein [bacterium]